MKRAVCLILSVLMLFACAQMLAEETWSDWSQLEPGLWHRTGAVPDASGMVMEQWATGATAAELVKTGDMMKGYGATGKLAWTSASQYGAQGEILSQTNYNYDENGVLTQGALTVMGADGSLETVWALIMIAHDDAGFTTQVQQYDKEDTLLGMTTTTYDTQGNFVSGTVLNMETKQNDAVTQPPEMDPIREEWLQKRS